jgi:putative hydrolase of the HAD superfamily
MIIVFDLDDTLYDERDYVYGGLDAVASYLKMPGAKEELRRLVTDAREQVFDRFLKAHNLYSKKLVRELVQIYRRHTPELALYPSAKRCLKRFEKYPLYLVTDGNYLVQERKVQALKIEPYFKGIIYTSRYGAQKAKPSPYCFTKIARVEKVKPNQVVYVADNPYKDFVGIKPRGFHTVRVRAGRFSNIRLDAQHEAELQIESLDELTEEKLVGSLFSNCKI